MVYMLLADGFEEVEALCPLDIMRRAGIEVRTVGITGAVVTGSHGIAVKADITPDMAADAADMVILPGGLPGATNLDASPDADRIVKEAAANGAYLAAICAAPLILGRRGLLQGKRATCYPGFENELAGAEVVSDPVAVDGNIITGKAMGAAAEFGYALTEALAGKEAADKVRAAVYA